MDINVQKNSPDSFTLTFGETDIMLDGDDMKSLLVHVMGILAPGGSTDKENRRSREYLSALKDANDLGVQRLLLKADHQDLLAFLKIMEEDEELQRKFFSNMSENNGKLFVEDISFEFPEGVPADREHKALLGLMKSVRALEDEGELYYGDPPDFDD